MLKSLIFIWIIYVYLLVGFTTAYFTGYLFPSPDLSTARLLFFYGSTFEEYDSYRLDEMYQIFQHSFYDPALKTILYAHGYNESGDSESVRTIVDAYIRRNDHNILALDWGELSKGRYFFSALPNTRVIGDRLGNILTQLYYQGIDIESIHMIGFSLGAHLCGTAGRAVINNTNGAASIPRITGLDPGFPGYYIKPFPRHISSMDADFVDIIHTDGSLAGAPFSTGTVDFWPNGGKFIQPGCPPRKAQISNPCSHQRAWRYWAESVAPIRGKKFLAIKANSWLHFIFGRFSTPTQYAIMGIDATSEISGNYYLETDSRPPFAKGKKGTIIHRQNYHSIFSQFFLFQIT